MPPQRNRRWIWFFVVLVALTILATTVMIVYNLQQQLKPEQLAAAHQLWKEKGPADYTLAFTKKIDERPDVEQFLIKVKGGRVVEGFMNGRPFDKMHHYSMDKLFDQVIRFQELSEEKGQPRVFCRAIFAPDTGAILWYVRRVMGSRDRVEITVEKLEADKN